MTETYLMLANFAQTWGLIYFVGVFLAVVVFVMSPSRKAKYEEAAKTPLRED